MSLVKVVVFTNKSAICSYTSWTWLSKELWLMEVINNCSSWGWGWFGSGYTEKGTHTASNSNNIGNILEVYNTFVL